MVASLWQQYFMGERGEGAGTRIGCGGGLTRVRVITSRVRPRVEFI